MESSLIQLYKYIHISQRHYFVWGVFGLLPDCTFQYARTGQWMASPVILFSHSLHTFLLYPIYMSHSFFNSSLIYTEFNLLVPFQKYRNPRLNFLRNFFTQLDVMHNQNGRVPT